MIACDGDYGYYLDCDCPDCRETRKALDGPDEGLIEKIYEALAGCHCNFCGPFEALHDLKMAQKAMTVEDILKAAGLADETSEG